VTNKQTVPGRNSKRGGEEILSAPFLCGCLTDEGSDVAPGRYIVKLRLVGLAARLRLGEEHVCGAISGPYGGNDLRALFLLE
jgi:hypothetical protein